ncbi:MAG TPA: SDR family NAD(P)-dependent oxidoreductase [Amycolatopsis sp.]|nr:SDR family NAD(P)-dependent oxidoreductase [Amycolatopsis sp.]
MNERPAAGASARRYAGRVAVVTGGASGIGLAIVRRVVAEGGRVAAGDVDSDGLERVRHELGDAVAVLETDVRREDQVERLVSTAVDRFGRLDAGFNAAGVLGGAPIWELAEQAWDQTIDVCLKGCFLAVKHEARRLIEQGEGGAIVNIASLMSQVPVWGSTPYTVAKAGIEMLTKNAALELGEHAIRVTAVSPGLIATPLTTVACETPEVRQAYLERIPMGRIGTPGDVAAAAAFLGSDEGSYVSGASLFVDGGWATTGHPDLRPK